MIGKATIISMGGNFPGFLPCIASDSVRDNVLSMSNVEDLYNMTYIPQTSYIIYLNDQDLIFHQHNTLYIADTSDWIKQ